MGAPIGNQNAAKAKQWTAAIERAIERLGDPSIDPDSPLPRTPKAKGMDLLAEAFVNERIRENPMAFFKELGDRVDGKAAQQVTLSGDEDNPIRLEKIVREVVKT